MPAESRTDAALRELMGFLDGIQADGRLVDDEVLWLDTWLRDNPYLRSDPDASALLEVTEDALHDGVITSTELQEINEAITRMREAGERRVGASENRDAITTELIGLLRGITADQSLVDDEVERLRFWARRAEEWSHWPLSEVRHRVEEAMRAGCVGELERQDLMGVAERLVGGNPAESGAIRGLPVQPEVTEGVIPVSGSRLCLTGQFVSGPRSHCERRTKEAGGAVAGNVSKKVDYVVVGDIASRDWAYSTFGRKVEKAMEYEIPVVTEFVWRQAIDQL